MPLQHQGIHKSWVIGMKSDLCLYYSSVFPLVISQPVSQPPRAGDKSFILVSLSFFFFLLEKSTRGMTAPIFFSALSLYSAVFDLDLSSCSGLGVVSAHTLKADSVRDRSGTKLPQVREGMGD